PLGLDIAAAEADVAVLEAEHAGEPVAVEDDVALEARKLPVGAGAVVGALELLRDLALDFAFEHVGLEAHRHAGLVAEAGVRMKNLGHRSLALLFTGLSRAGHGLARPH